MRLHLRKQAAQQIELSRSQAHFASTDYFEQEILDAASEDESAVACGRLVVLSAELLEQVRRADPAYGLRRVSA